MNEIVDADVSRRSERTKSSAGTVELDGLQKEFGEITAVDGLSLRIESGEFLTLLGPSGCGKSTTLRMISGLETPTAGDVYISGERITSAAANKRDTSMVFQEWALFPHMTVEENISFGLEMDGVPADERADRVSEALELVELPGYHDRKATELSGGQKQRVAMARAIVCEPDVLLLDEPLASLDRKLRQHMQVELKKIQEELGITFIYVTHDQEEALTMSDRIAVVNEGQIEQVGPPNELYKTPETKFVATFLGETNLFEGMVSSDGTTLQSDDYTINVDGRGAHGGAQAVLSVRPEEIAVADSDGHFGYQNEWEGTVTEAIYKGSLKNYQVDIGSRSLEVECQSNNKTDDFDVGDRVTIGFPSTVGQVIAD
ncbi:ABC transporter ATP-binding protein [Natronosalvus halobius]|uniref:ABC transporter ATP-binding protein n=1 Tax=Natronosalvus halobius TaxID=2953746 RepID=UPI00209F7C7C|nr:ABC transporter ATP-binding protein [Natronosalvus halobius]USZ73710.1 ABC transporter ATP-binding protein [Natronosalvus halobius]